MAPSVKYLDVERLSAAALALDVRVVEAEGLVQALFDEVDRGAIDERQALGIDEHLDAVFFENVVCLYGIVGVVHVRQIEALGKPGDAALAISTSGGSANVVAALAVARRLGLRTIALTGRDGGEAGRAAEIHINVPSPSTARVQEVHRTLLHVICELVENAFVA